SADRLRARRLPPRPPRQPRRLRLRLHGVRTPRPRRLRPRGRRGVAPLAPPGSHLLCWAFREAPVPGGCPRRTTPAAEQPLLLTPSPSARNEEGHPPRVAFSHIEEPSDGCEPG